MRRKPQAGLWRKALRSGDEPLDVHRRRKACYRSVIRVDHLNNAAVSPNHSRPSGPTDERGKNPRARARAIGARQTRGMQARRRILPQALHLVAGDKMIRRLRRATRLSRRSRSKRVNLRQGRLFAAVIVCERPLRQPISPSEVPPMIEPSGVEMSPHTNPVCGRDENSTVASCPRR